MTTIQTDLRQPESQMPTFQKGQQLQSPTHGFVEFKGMDNYMGEVTFHFYSHTYRTDCYWLPRALRAHLPSAFQAPAAPQQAVAASSESVALTDEFIADVTLRICELPDRDSPEDWPDAMIVTGEELTNCIRNAEEDFSDTGRPIFTRMASTNQPVQAKALTDDLYILSTNEDSMEEAIERFKGSSTGEALKVVFAAQKSLRALLASQPSAQPLAKQEPEWINDPHDIEQGMMRNPKYRPQPSAQADVAAVRDAAPEDEPQIRAALERLLNRHGNASYACGLNNNPETYEEISRRSSAARHELEEFVISLLHRKSAAPTAPIMPTAVTEWYQAEKARIDAVHAYNARLKYVQQHMPFGTSVDPEYQLMHHAEKKARSLLKPMFDALDAATTAQPQADGVKPCISY